MRTTAFGPAARHHREKGFKIHLLVFVLVMPASWLVWTLTPKTYPWPIWQTIGWAFGIWFHYLGIYVFNTKHNR